MFYIRGFKVFSYSILITITHSIIALEDLKQEAGDDAGYTDEEVNDDKEDISSAGFVEEEWWRVHHWCDRPTARKRQENEAW